MNITYVSPFDYAKPELWVKLEPEACVFFQIFREANEIKQTKLPTKEKQDQTMGDR